jgi:hypothetical protein
MRVTGFTMERAKAIVDGANAAFREAELKRLEESVESVRRAVDAFLKPDAFTVGSKGSYDNAIEGWAQKTGFRPPGDKDIPEGYEGGWVWRSKIAAWAWLCGVDPVQEDGPVPDHRRLGDSMISFEGRPRSCATSTGSSFRTDGTRTSRRSRCREACTGSTPSARTPSSTMP